MAKDQPIPRVSVILCTFRQERYVREAVRSILAQRVDFDYEIVVADDCSPDATLHIIRHELAGASNVKFLPSVTNIGLSQNYKRAFTACSGKYISVLEGDDFWSSRDKLASQVKLLEEHGECSLAISQTCVYFEDRGRCGIQPAIDSGAKITRFRVEDLIKSNFTNFSGATYRAELVRRIPDRYFEIKAYDWLLHLWMAQFGLIGCVNDVQVVYRVHGGGLWSGLADVEKLRAQRDVIDIYDEFLGHRYSTEFRQLRAGLDQALGLAAAERVATAPQSKRPYGILFPLAHLARSVLPPGLARRLRPIWGRMR